MATRTNFLQARETYNRYYGDFRGVDFSSDHTQVDEHRLAYAVNMYRDYQSSQGQALETIAGFRKRVVLPEESEVFGIFNFSHKNSENKVVTKVLIHSGEKLYLWKNYPNTANIVLSETIVVPEPDSVVNGTKTFRQILPENVVTVTALAKTNGEDLTFLMNYDATTRELSYASSDLSAGDRLLLSYKEGILTASDALFSSMNPAKSTSFIFNNRLYIIDGKNYLVYDGEKVVSVLDNAYIPLTYINIITSGENADIGKEHEQRNILQPKFRHTFIADGTTTEFFLNENALDEISEVKVYGQAKTQGTDYTVDLAQGSIKFNTAPAKPEQTIQIEGTAGSENVYYPEMYAGIEVIAKKVFTSVSGVTDECAEISRLITDCTIATIYDNRVFLSGNPNYPNHIFYAARNSTGYVDPSYFGVLNYMQDGVGIAPITGMITVADTLNVLEPILTKSFIYDNYASQVGKGTDLGLSRLTEFLRKYYRQHKSADGWVLKCDIRKYFYNINHGVLKSLLRKHISCSDTLWLLDMIIDSTEGEVGIPIGNQSSQLFALLYLNGLDHYIKEKLGIKFYGRYMDDFYLIHEDKEYLKNCLREIIAYVGNLGLELNEKTQISPLRNGIDFLGFHTYLTDSGKVIRKLRRQSKTGVCRRLKKFKTLHLQGKLPMSRIECSYRSWRGHAERGNCYHLIRKTDKLYNELFKKEDNKCRKH